MSLPKEIFSLALAIGFWATPLQAGASKKASEEASSREVCRRAAAQELWERKLLLWVRHVLNVHLRAEVPEEAVSNVPTMVEHFRSWEGQVTETVTAVVQTEDKRVRDSAMTEVERFLKDYVTHPSIESGGHLPGDHNVVREEQNGFDFFKEYRDWVARYDEEGHLIFLEYVGLDLSRKGMKLQSGERPPEGMNARLADVVKRTLLSNYLPFEREDLVPFVKDPKRRRELLEGAKRSYLRWRLIEIAERFYQEVG